MTKQLNYIAYPAQTLRGAITVPGDKSMSHRGLMLAAIANGQSQITGLLTGDDNIATLRALQQLGVKILQQDDVVTVHGVGLQGLHAPQSQLDLGNSGTGMRLLAGLLAGQSFESELVGDASLMRRPMQRIIDPLLQMGAMIAAGDKGMPPLKISGHALHGIDYCPPMVSAQVKSCILLAGLYAAGRTRVIEAGKSRDHTERMLQTFGCPVLVDGLVVSITGGQALQATSLTIPGDISSAAFFIVAACISPNANIILRNVGVNPTRTGIIEILQRMQANIEMINQHLVGAEPVADIRVSASELQGIEIPTELVANAIDELPVILVAAACARGTTVLRNAGELRVKETDRLAAMAEGLSRLGIEIDVFADGMVVHGGTIAGGQVNSFTDHRIAMAFAVAATVANEPVEIVDCANVTTSFPNFVALANTLGMQITEKEQTLT